MTLTKPNWLSELLRPIRAKTLGGTEIKPGTRIRFIRPDGNIQSDTVRHIFWQETLEEKGVALILTNHSWCWTRDVKELIP